MMTALSRLLLLSFHSREPHHWLLAPSGCFMLGSDATKDVHALPNEQPLTRICFLLPFWIDQFPVWQAQFKQFKGQATHASVFTGDKRPVESITWVRGTNVLRATARRAVANRGRIRICGARTGQSNLSLGQYICSGECGLF